jgi:dTMP kinase
MTSGLFLSLDGIDGTGKTTQCRLLADWLRHQGYQVVCCTDPGGTPVGQELRQIVLGKRYHLVAECEALLFMASRAQLVAEVIRPALHAGHLVLSDRFLLANVAYQGYGAGLDIDLLWAVGKLSTSGLEPDLTLVLDLPIEQARHRRNRPADRLEDRSEDFHDRVRQGFLCEARRRPDRIVVVDASGTPEQVQTLLQERIAQVLKRGS